MYSGYFLRTHPRSIEGTKYGDWREDYKNGMDMLAKLIEEPYPARSELRKEVTNDFGRVIHGLKPRQITLSYREPIKNPEMEKIDSSLQYKYVQKCANNAFAPRHHVRLLLPVKVQMEDNSSTYAKYAIGQAIVDIHILQDGVWTVQTKQRREAVVCGKQSWNHNQAVVSIPGQWKCDQSGTFMSLGMNQHRQIQVWTGNHASNEVSCMTLKERNPNTHVIHTFREPSSRARGTRSPGVKQPDEPRHVQAASQSPGPPLVTNSMSAGAELNKPILDTSLDTDADSSSSECTSSSAQTSSKCSSANTNIPEDL
jgi:hypothetical protein